MNDETKTTRPPASLEDSCERMKSRLQEAAIEIAQALESAEGAERTGERWQLLSRGLGKAQNALGLDGWQKTIGRTWHDPAADIPPVAEPIDPNAPKMVRGERSMIGIRSTTSAMIAWNFQDIHIVCDAQRIEEGKWRIVGRANGEERISAIVTGGRWAANVYLKFIRNGMTARARRLKGLRMKAAAAAEPQREVS